MAPFSFILADIDDGLIKGIIVVLGLIIWGVSALAKAAKQGIDKQKERMQQVREQMARDQQQRARAPVQLAPEIARRVPAPVRPLPKQNRKQQAPRAATNYNAMGQAPKRHGAAPPPIPTLELEPEETHTLMPREPMAPPPERKASGVAAPAIRRWLTPSTLRQQFILTEVFQPPIALREPK